MDTRWQQCNGYLFFIEMMCENFPKGMKVIIKTRAGIKFKGMFVINNIYQQAEYAAEVR